MKNRRTSRTTRAQPTSSGVAKQLSRMVEDATRKYPGGTKNAELVKGHPNFREWLYTLYDALALEQEQRLLITQRPVLKTVRLGTGLRSVEDFTNAIQNAGGKVSDQAREVLGKGAFASAVLAQPKELNLILVSVAELGFPSGATLKDIYAKAKTFGLELCPCEVGPQLCLQYLDQPDGEWLRVAMEPITNFDGYPRVFYVEHNSHGYWDWLSTDCGSLSNVWHGDSRWVFVRHE